MSATIELRPAQITKWVWRHNQLFNETVTIEKKSGAWSAYEFEVIERAYTAWVDVEPDNLALDNGGKESIKLAIKLPTGAKVGNHSFKIEAANPDLKDDRAVVAITLKLLPPWLLALLVLLVILLVILVYWLIARTAAAAGTAQIVESATILLASSIKPYNYLSK